MRSSRLEQLPPEVLSHIFGYLPSGSARNAAQVSKVFASELNRRYPPLSSENISLYDAFYPTFGDAFTKLLFRKIIPMIVYTTEVIPEMNNLVVEYYHPGNVQLNGTLHYTANISLSLNTTGYFDDNGTFYITGNIVLTDMYRKLVITPVGRTEIHILFTKSDTNTRREYKVIKFGRLVLFHNAVKFSLFIMSTWNNQDTYEIDQTDVSINNMLSYAIDDSYLDIVEYLVSQGADIHADKDRALVFAASRGHIAVVKYLVNNGAHVNTVQKIFTMDEYMKLTPLGAASLNGHLDVVKYLLLHGADVGARQNDALIQASYIGHFDIVKYLVDHGAKVNAQENEALIQASARGHAKVVRYLLEHGANAYARDNEALKRATENGHSTVVELLLDHRTPSAYIKNIFGRWKK